MPRISTASVKNIVRRGFNELVDPEPSAAERARIWAHFQSRCAYCGVALTKEKQEGRIDHAVSAAATGSNGLGNRVLACGRCNDHEKRDEHWDVFLKRKNTEPAIYHQRRESIVGWMKQHHANDASSELLQAAAKAAEEVNALFESKVTEIRALIANPSRRSIDATG